MGISYLFFFSSRRRHTRWNCDWSSDVCSSDLRHLNGYRNKGLWRGKQCVPRVVPVAIAIDETKELRPLNSIVKLRIPRAERRFFEQRRIPDLIRDGRGINGDVVSILVHEFVKKERHGNHGRRNYRGSTRLRSVARHSEGKSLAAKCKRT